MILFEPITAVSGTVPARAASSSQWIAPAATGPTRARMFRRTACLILSLAAFAAAMGSRSALNAQRLPTIAAAANLNFALTEIADQFARERGSRIEVVFGASGALMRQIHDGAPFELFLAADEEFPNRLTAAGLTRDAGAVYAVGRLVIFAPTGSPLTVDERLDGLARLVKAGGVGRFAIANPEIARTGRRRRKCCASVDCWTLFARGWSWATRLPRRPSSRRPGTRSAVSSPNRWCLVPGLRIAAPTH